MPACVAMPSSTSPRSPAAMSDFMSPSSTALNGWVVVHSGCCGANTFTRSRAKASWVYIGCSTHKVPSLSNVAMRSAGGTKSGPPCRVTRATKPVIACLLGPSFHDGSGSLDAAVCASAGLGRSDAENAGSTARAESSARRLTPGKKGFCDMAATYLTLASGRPTGPPRSHVLPKEFLGRQRQSLEFLASGTKTAKLINRRSRWRERERLERLGEHFLQVDDGGYANG